MATPPAEEATKPLTLKNLPAEIHLLIAQATESPITMANYLTAVNIPWQGLSTIVNFQKVAKSRKGGVRDLVLFDIAMDAISKANGDLPVLNEYITFTDSYKENWNRRNCKPVWNNLIKGNRLPVAPDLVNARVIRIRQSLSRLRALTLTAHWLVTQLALLVLASEQGLSLDQNLGNLRSLTIGEDARLPDSAIQRAHRVLWQARNETGLNQANNIVTSARLCWQEIWPLFGIQGLEAIHLNGIVAHSFRFSRDKFNYFREGGLRSLAGSLQRIVLSGCELSHADIYRLTNIARKVRLDCLDVEYGPIKSTWNDGYGREDRDTLRCFDGAAKVVTVNAYCHKSTMRLTH